MTPIHGCSRSDGLRPHDRRSSLCARLLLRPSVRRLAKYRLCDFKDNIKTILHKAVKWPRLIDRQYLCYWKSFKFIYHFERYTKNTLNCVNNFMSFLPNFSLAQIFLYLTVYSISLTVNPQIRLAFKWDSNSNETHSKLKKTLGKNSHILVRPVFGPAENE